MQTVLCAEDIPCYFTNIPSVENTPSLLFPMGVCLASGGGAVNYMFCQGMLP